MKVKPGKPANGNKADVRVRMYRVGFGDFFLMTVNPNGNAQHILIDCGVTPGTTHNGDIGTIKDAVAHMAKETNNKLALVIVTHRHMDHIIGFSRCADVFKNFAVDAVWMPYWESEYDQNAAKFQADLTSLALDVQRHLALSAGENSDVDEMLGMLRNATGVDHEEFPMAAAAKGGSAAKAKKGTGGGSNAASLAILKTGLGVKPEYYARGDAPKLPPALVTAGLTAEILGPPPSDAVAFMKLTDLKKGVGQYLGLGDAASGNAKKFDPFGAHWRASADDFPPSAFREFAPRGKEALLKPQAGSNQLEAAVQGAQPDLLLTAVKTMDSFLNNQSLVVLFTFAGKKLLFVGDAQAGNWEYWMYGGTPNKAPSVDALAPDGKTILTHLDFYKVGHHGSTNATPVSAVEAMNSDFAAMCSTQEDSYGSKDKGTEVPRDPLLAALEKKSALVRSDQIEVTLVGNQVPPAKHAATEIPQPASGRFEVGEVYVDYLL